ncbi:unnamed protein product, partial [Rotaria magnacalcarata]
HAITYNSNQSGTDGKSITLPIKIIGQIEQ